jgi:hypothetical protein
MACVSVPGAGISKEGPISIEDGLSADHSLEMENKNLYVECDAAVLCSALRCSSLFVSALMCSVPLPSVLPCHPSRLTFSGQGAKRNPP